MRRLLPLLVALTILIAISLVPQANVSLPNTSQARIVDPEYSRPAFVDAGTEANVTLRVDVGALGYETYTVELYSFNISVKAVATIVDYGNGTIVLSFTVPENIPEGLYDVKVYGDGREVAWMPRAFYVKHGELTRLRIMHLTDIHLGASDKGIDNTFKNTKYIMLSLLAHRDLDVDLAIVTGDIVDVGSDVPSLKATFMEFNQFRIPTFMVPGNHDWAQVANLDAFLNNFYGRYINSKQYWYRVIDEFIIIGLDTTGYGFLSFEQIEFLNETLNKYPDKVAIIAFHHPIFNQPGEYQGPVDNWIGSAYSSWRDHRQNLEAFMNVINSHPNVALVLAGHIHRDADAVYNGRVYFVTTTTANHGTPTYWGFKIVDVYANGTVIVRTPPGKDDLFSGRTSYNTEYIMTYEVASPDHTTVVWRLKASRAAELDLSNAPLLFYMNASQGPYKVYDPSGVVNGYKVYSYGDYLVYLVNATVPTDEEAYVIVSNTLDQAPPTVEITMFSPKKPTGGGKLTVYITAQDEGWGVASVKLLYKQGANWKEARVIEQKGYYIGVITGLRPGSLELKAVAVDYAGNEAETQTVTIEVGGGTTTTGQAGGETTTTTTTGTAGATGTGTTTGTGGETEGGLPPAAVAGLIVVIVIAAVALLVSRR